MGLQPGDSSLPSTPAIGAGIAGHPWTLAELLDRLEECRPGRGLPRPGLISRAGLFRARGDTKAGKLASGGTS
jgi:hypothetical protein